MTKSCAYAEQLEPGGGLKYAASWGAHCTGVLLNVAARTPPIPMMLLAFSRSFERSILTVGRWVYIIHPVTPEDTELAVWPDDTIEQAEHHEEERENIRNDRKGWCKGADPLPPGCLE